MGGGHNSLVAATYLGKAGKKVLVLEAQAEIGGATTSVRAFPDFDARLSRYSYLVSLLPDQIIKDLGLNFSAISRDVSSYTPYVRNSEHRGLLVSRTWDDRSAESFESLTGSRIEAQSWIDFYEEISRAATMIAPTLLEPLPTRAELRKRVASDHFWSSMIENPIGQIISQTFEDDIVRGVVLTDGLIGTFASAFDIQANICFLYHLIGNGTGEWKVPKGGMGALVSELQRVAIGAGVHIQCNSEIVGIESETYGINVETVNGEKFSADFLLSNAAPSVLKKLVGEKQEPFLAGSQLKVNMLLERLPRLKSGVDPKLAFAGTFHVNESFDQLEKAFMQARSGELPIDAPSEMYCHTLTDPTILSPELIEKGFHTLTLFGLHTPAELFDENNEMQRSQALKLALTGLDNFLDEPIESVIAKALDGSLCIEVKSPIDLESAIGLPRGNIFHKDLEFPFREEDSQPGWGVETDNPRIFTCGAGSVRGGGVSGIPGHNAAMAILSRG